MFISKVYRHSKWMFGGMLFFVVMQLLCFYKGGMVVSPWYNYGMFSHQIKIDSVYTVCKAGNLQGHQFTPQGWDKIHYTKAQYDALPANDTLYEKEVKRLFAKLLLPVPAKKYFVPDTNTIPKPPGANYSCAQYTWNGQILSPAK